MGLDMYLRADRYVSGYEHAPDEVRAMFGELVASTGAEKIVAPNTRSATVTFTVAYWRKANAIHQWFVDNVQNGKDDCASYYVSREKLAELRDLCQLVVDTAKLDRGEVNNGHTFETVRPTDGSDLEPVVVESPNVEDGFTITNPEEVHALLPTQSGFFFGSTDYDQWYFEDVKETIEQIDRALLAGDEWSFEYQSSW